MLKRVLAFLFFGLLVTFLPAAMSFADNINKDIKEKVLINESDAFRKMRLRVLSEMKGGRKYDIGQADIISYDLSCRMDPAAHYLETRAKVVFKSKVDGLTDIKFIVYDDALNIISVTQGADTLSYESSPGDVIIIYLNSSLDTGDSDSLEIYYTGYITPQLSSDYGFSCQLDAIYSYSTSSPWVWYPYSYDNYYSSYYGTRLDDLYTAKMKFTVPSGYTAVSNGRLADSTLSDSVNVYDWECEKPIETMTFAIAPYIFTAIPYDTIEISHYDPDTSDSAGPVLNALGSIMDYYASHFGEYFLCKLAIADHGANFGYGGNTLVQLPLPTSLLLLSHEVSHQWWGQMAGLRYWQDIWLTEGFAMSSSLLIIEDSLGRDSLKASAGRWETMYKTLVAYDEPIIPAPFYNDGYHYIVYRKGGLVLHMLRGMVGDAAFFDIMRTYFTTYRDSSVTPEMFIQVSQQVSGQDLGWFFNEWLYNAGYPIYNTVAYFKTSPDSNSARFKVWQSSSIGGNLFKMPLSLCCSTSVGRGAQSAIWDSLDCQEFVISDTMPVLELLLDPDNWVINDEIRQLPVLMSLGTPIKSDGSSIHAIWEVFYDPSCAGYNIYRAENAGGPFTRVNQELIKGTSFTDTTTTNSTEYYYAVTAVDSADTCYETHFSNILSCVATAGVEGDPDNKERITDVELYQNAPNPFTETTTIGYQIAKPGNVNISIYNINGQLVKTLVNDYCTTGRYKALWNGRDNTGQKTSSGIYLVKLTTQDKNISRMLQQIR